MAASLPNVEILYKGYYPPGGTMRGRVCSTVTLVVDKGLHIIVDPGTLPHHGVLTEELKKRALSVDDINIVFITHSHVDHYRYAGLFTQAKVLDYWGWWIGDTWGSAAGSINENIKVLETPGHTDDSITLSVRTNIGTVAICGDVFWDKDYPVEDPYAVDKKLLQSSRKKVLETADYIIPGHGDIFASEDGWQMV